MKDDKGKDFPEPEIFTLEIEDTIDDLFTPSKQIEIDPLTQKVKDLEDESDDLSLDFDFMEEKAAAPEEAVSLQEVEPIQETEFAQEAQQPAEGLLDMDMDLEMEIEDAVQGIDEAAPAAQADAAVQPAPSTSPPASELADDTENALSELRQQIFTIEWEVTSPQIQQTLDIVSSLLINKRVMENTMAVSMLALLKKILDSMKDRPELVPASAPSLLKKASEYLLNAFSGYAAESEGKQLINELDQIVGELEKTVAMQPTGAAPAEEALPKLDAETRPASAEAEEILQKQDVISEEELKSRPAQDILATHVVELKRCVKRIESLEKLLSRTPGVEGLYKFQNEIRTILERQQAELERLLFEGTGTEAPAEEPVVASEKKETPQEQPAKEPPAPACPWKKLLTINYGDIELGFPEDQVAYMGVPPWLSRSTIRASATVALNRLKPWPWSKLKGRVQNKLSHFDEAVLSGMHFPIVRGIGGQEAPIPSSYTLVILYDGKKGAAFMVAESPISVEIPENSECKKKGEDYIEAEIQTPGSRISVVTTKSLTKE